MVQMEHRLSYTAIIVRCRETPCTYMKKSIESTTFSDLSHILLIHKLDQKTWDTGKHLQQPLSDWVPTAKNERISISPIPNTFWLPSYPLFKNWRNRACDSLDVLHWHESSLVAKSFGTGAHKPLLHLHLTRCHPADPVPRHPTIWPSSLIGRV
jgi:hypothetical protein